ncbi:hypothetical protein GCM10009610_68110 [Pseudonocardia xinjiangensis]
MAEPDDEIVRFMVTFGVADALLRLHTDDRTGHCRVCSAGPQAGRAVHPCRLRLLAQRARARLAARS